MAKKTKLSRIFPGWWLVLVGGFINFWGVGYSYYGFSALFKPISSELGFSRAVTSVASSMARLEGGIEGVVTGGLTDRFGPRRVMLFGVCLYVLGLVLMYFVNSLWAFYLVWGGILGTGTNIIQGIPITTAITNWFVKKRGLAFGLRMMITGGLFLPVLTWLIITLGWRLACVIGGLGMLVVGLPLIWFCVKDKRPEYYGFLPDGARLAERSTDAIQMIERGIRYATEVEEIEFTLRQALRTPAYWQLLVISSFGMLPIMPHLIPLLTDMGMSPTRAAATVSLASLASVFSRFFSGLVADRVRTSHLRFLIGGNLSLLAVGITLFVLYRTPLATYLFLVIFFFTLGVNLIVISVTEGRYFGRKATGSIRGSLSLVGMPAGFFGPILVGWAYDATGSYDIALTIIVPLLALAAITAFFALPPKPPSQVSGISKIW